MKTYFQQLTCKSAHGKATLKIKLALLCSLFFAGEASTQTYTFDWSSSLSPSWAQGNTSGSATNVNSSGINVTVALTNSQPSSFGNFTGFTSPKISSGGNPFSASLGSNSPNLALGVGWSSNTQYVDVKITFSTAVSNVSFNVVDIDKTSNNNNSYLDQITVTGMNGAVSTANPTLTKLVSGSNYVVIAGNTAYANPTNGQGGNSASSSADQNATVTVAFGVTAVTSITLRYNNNAASSTTPAIQAIGIGNISFQKAASLPVILENFTAHESGKGVVLNWQTAQESNSKDFTVQRSTDGVNWNDIAILPAQGNSNVMHDYSSTDENAPAGNNYYRLIQTDLDGHATYSEVLNVLVSAGTQAVAQLYPNPVYTQMMLSITCTENATLMVELYNASGQLKEKYAFPVTAGANRLTLPQVQQLSRGLYTVLLYTGSGKTRSSLSFIKL